MASPILHTVVWGKQEIVGGRVRGVSILRFPEIERLRVVPSLLLELLISYVGAVKHRSSYTDPQS